MSLNHRLSPDAVQIATERLGTCISLAKLEPDALASYDRQRDLDALYTTLSEVLERDEAYPNPVYVGLAAGLAGVLELWERAPDAYAQLVRLLDPSGVGALLDTWQGLNLLRTLAQGLSDDHDFGYDPVERSIVHGLDLSCGQTGLTASLFASLVIGLLDAYPHSKSQTT